MSAEAHPSEAELATFLGRHRRFGGWVGDWAGVPIESHVYLSDELPPLEWIGSVRALVLRGDEVLLVHSSPPILNVGGRPETGETPEETLLREVGEETGWRIAPIAIIGFCHRRHLDAQRPAWGRPAPSFVDPLFAVEAVEYVPALCGTEETPCEFVQVSAVERHGIEAINQTYLREALRKRAKIHAPKPGTGAQT